MEDRRVTGREGRSSEQLPINLRRALQRVWADRQGIVCPERADSEFETIYDRVYQILSGSPKITILSNSASFKRRPFRESETVKQYRVAMSIIHNFMTEHFTKRDIGGFVNYFPKVGDHVARSRIYINADPSRISQVMQEIAAWTHPQVAPVRAGRPVPPPSAFATSSAPLPPTNTNPTPPRVTGAPAPRPRNDRPINASPTSPRPTGAGPPPRPPRHDRPPQGSASAQLRPQNSNSAAAPTTNLRATASRHAHHVDPPPTRYFIPAPAPSVTPTARHPDATPPPLPKDVVSGVKYALPSEAFGGRRDMIVIYLNAELPTAEILAGQLARHLSADCLRPDVTSLTHRIAAGISVATEDKERQGSEFSFTQYRATLIAKALVECTTDITNDMDFVFLQWGQQVEWMSDRGYECPHVREISLEQFERKVAELFEREGINLSEAWK